MANINRRGSTQNQSIVFRCTLEDKVLLKDVASKQGSSISELIRSLLIQHKLIQPTYITDEI